MDRDYIRDALLQHNYFPNQKEKSRELPPCFQTIGLTAAVADKVRSAGAPFGSGFKGHDYVPYTLTRFNGGPRVCGVPHPFAYCRLVLQMHTSWQSLEPYLASEASAIQPRVHSDGRLFIMSYGSHTAKSIRYMQKAAGARFIAKADIANFFPSIYTHAIPWAIVGVDQAKQAGASNKWYDKIDKLVRDCRRAETNGVSVGPGTSSIVAEIILTRVDRKLQKRFSFDRFIDDYTAYCSSRLEAEEFIRLLEFELSRFNLFLNFGKTYIGSMPCEELPEWVDRLRVQDLPSSPTLYDLKAFLSRAIHLSEQFKDGSVLRYAVNALVGRRFGRTAGRYLAARLLGVALNNLHLSSSIHWFLPFAFDKAGRFTMEQELTALVAAAVSSRRSDAICWALWLVREAGVTLDQPLQEKCRKVFDVFGSVSLYMIGSAVTRRNITTWVRKRVLTRPSSVQERNWMLIHYLLGEGKLAPKEVKDKSLRALHANGVKFYS